MQIGAAAQASGVTAKMIRYYESIGLLPAAGRRSSNYRDFTPEDVGRLQFIRRARDLGFSVEQIRDLLRLWSDRERASAEVKAIALAHIAELEARRHAIEAMASTLQALADACEGSARPDCPILQRLESGGPQPVV